MVMTYKEFEEKCRRNLLEQIMLEAAIRMLQEHKRLGNDQW